MHFRPPDEQNDHKVTCGVNVGVLQKVLDQIQGSLDKARVQANIIVSGTGGHAECNPLLLSQASSGIAAESAELDTGQGAGAGKHHGQRLRWACRV
jgi:hypothetical protein